MSDSAALCRSTQESLKHWNAVVCPQCQQLWAAHETNAVKAAKVQAAHLRQPEYISYCIHVVGRSFGLRQHLVSVAQRNGAYGTVNGFTATIEGSAKSCVELNLFVPELRFQNFIREVENFLVVERHLEIVPFKESVKSPLRCCCP